MNFTFASKDLTDEKLAQAATEIETAKSRARTAWDWTLIRDCQAMLEFARQQATPSGRLQVARELVRPFGKDWTPQTGSR